MMPNASLEKALKLCAEEGISFYCAHSHAPKLHSHEWIELAYLENGTLIHSVGGVNYRVNEGEYFIVEYGQPHDYVVLSEGPINLKNVMFHPRFIDPTLRNARRLSEIFNHYLVHFNEKQLRMSPTLNKFSDPTGNIHGYINDIAREVEEKQFGWRESVRGLLIHIIIQTLRSIAADDYGGEDMTFSRSIIDFVNANYMRPIKISDAFGSGQYNTPYLSKHFKQETGMTFSEYLKHVRISASRRLLSNTDKSVAEISELVGYADTTFFHNTFRNMIGCTPLEYRKNYSEKEYVLAVDGEFNQGGRRYVVRPAGSVNNEDENGIAGYVKDIGEGKSEKE